MKTNFLRVNNLSFAIHHTKIIENVCFDVAKGEMVAIVGANGCGKSTLLRLLSGILRPNSGEILIDGLSLQKSRDTPKILSCIAYSPDHPALYPNDTVSSYLRFIANLKKIPSKEISQRIADKLAIFDLSAYSNTLIYKLSKGLQQRLNLTQAMLNNPHLLLLDEPTDGLDTAHCDNLVKCMQQLQQQEVTIIIASHNYNAIIPLCNYMLKINAGHLERILLPTTTTKVVETYDYINTPA